MRTLSVVDTSADIACTLPVNEMRDRLRELQGLVGDRLESAILVGDKLRIRMDRDGDEDLDRKVVAWAEVEKGCCAFLGFAIESDLDVVTLEIAAPTEATATLEGIEWIFQAAGQMPA